MPDHPSPQVDTSPSTSASCTTPILPATPAWPPKSAPRLFLTGEWHPGALSENASVALDGPQAHYLLRVMRCTPGDLVILCDDVSGEWAAQIARVTKRDLLLTCTHRLRAREAVPNFTLCAALLKKDRFDFLLEKACELGVAHIQPVLTRRCVADHLNLDRARAILIEAAEQCARTALPTLASPLTLQKLLSGWDEQRALFFADESGGENAAMSFASHRGPAALLIGPEGGFEHGERDAICAHSFARAISLGPRILRAETAAIAGASLWMARNGDWQAAPNSTS